MATQNNYLNFLKDLKLFCDFEKSISIQDLAQKHKLKYYAHVSKILINNGIIKKTNMHNSYGPYIWNTIEPNIYMANELSKKLYEIGMLYKEKYNKKAKDKTSKTIAENKDSKKYEITESKSIENLHLDSITFKLFWIPIKLKLNYKTIN